MAVGDTSYFVSLDPSGNAIRQKMVSLGGSPETWAQAISGTISVTNAANGTPGSAAPATATQVAGTDGTNLRVLSTDSSGVLNINAPAGGATSALQTTGNSSLSTIATNTTNAATTTLQTTGNTSLSTIATNTTGVATAAKQPALGTLGTPSNDVLTIQGGTSGFPLAIAGATAGTVMSATNPLSVLMAASTALAALFGSSNSDGLAVTGNASLMVTNSVTRTFNGTSYDRSRSNVEITAATALAAQAAGTVNGADQTNYNGRGVALFVNVSAITAATLTVNIQGKDAVSGNYVTILSTTALATTGTVMLTVYPGVATAANSAASAVLPRTWRVQSVVTGTSVTATFGATNLL